jgi:hypothetical protein
MAAFLLYGGGSVAAWFVGRNIVYRGTNAAIDYVLNVNADSHIKETHTVRSIIGMLEAYKTMKEKHPAFESMISVRESLSTLEDAISTAQMRYDAHVAGYISRWRTFDASLDNKRIDGLTIELMKRLELFSTLLKCS